MGATLLIEHSITPGGRGKAIRNQECFATATFNAFITLDTKLIQAGIRADELRGDHLAALRKELELIVRASMADLVHEFDIVAKAADAVFAELFHWYTFGIGASGASHALGKFKGEYDLLLAQGKDKEASDYSRVRAKVRRLPLQ